MLSVFMLSVIVLNVIMLSVFMLNDIMLSVLMLSVIMLSVIMLSVIMLNVFKQIIYMLSVFLLNFFKQIVYMLSVFMLSVIIMSWRQHGTTYVSSFPLKMLIKFAAGRILAEKFPRKRTGGPHTSLQRFRRRRRDRPVALPDQKSGRIHGKN